MKTQCSVSRLLHLVTFKGRLYTSSMTTKLMEEILSKVRVFAILRQTLLCPWHNFWNYIALPGFAILPSWFDVPIFVKLLPNSK